MDSKLLKAILLLPGTVGIIIPSLILFLFHSEVTPASPVHIRFWLGALLLTAGLVLGIWTVSLFKQFGRGTPAPWEPPAKLVVRGPYRYVRNPMITGMILILAGQAVLLSSPPLGLWLLIFFLANAIYFPLVEERGLKVRFGQEYLEYMTNVPRWLPRLSPWSKTNID